MSVMAHVLCHLDPAAPEADGANCRDSDEGQGPASVPLLYLPILQMKKPGLEALRD